MKKLIVPILVAGAFLSSCDQDRLNVVQKSADNTDNFYQSDADAQSALIAMYDQFQGEIAGNEGIWNAYIMGLNYSADDVFAAGGDVNDHADFRILNEFRFDANSAPIKTLYNHIYKAIYSANLVINYFDKADASDFQKKAVAEAKVMRAWAHFLSAAVYNTPPIMDHLLGAGEFPTNAESQKAIYEWVLKECKEAIPNLAERNGSSDKEGAWYVTKGFGQFVAGKAALFLGKNDECISIMKDLVESPNYALVSGDRYRDLFHVEGDGCEEKIFEFNYLTNTALAGGSESWRPFNGRGRWMVADVLNWRGDDIPGGSKSVKITSAAGWGGGSINHEFAHKMLDNDGVDSYRRKATFLTSDEFMYEIGWGSDEHVYQTDKEDPTKIIERVLPGDEGKDRHILTDEEKKFDNLRGINNIDPGSFSRADIMEVKNMMHPDDAGAVGETDNNTNFMIARLAEAYLIYAEACINAGKLDEAKKYINKIQERAGSKTISSAVDMQVLRDEKQYELWFEGCRRLDIVRWGIAKECYDKVLDNIPYQFDEFWETVLTKVKIKRWTPKKGDKPGEWKDGDTTVVIKDGHAYYYQYCPTRGGQMITDLDGNSDFKTPKGELNTRPHKLRYEVKHPFADIAKVKLEYVKGKHDYWPIPQSILDVNPNMKQNPGW